MILLNIEEEELKRIAIDLDLPSFPNKRKLEEIISILYGIEEVETNKLLKIADWLFSIITNHLELKTAIVYGIAHKKDDFNTDSYVALSNQPFYHPPLSYFANHSVELAFSLSEKLAQLINVIEDINKNIEEVSLYNFTNENVLRRTPKMQDSKFLEPLKSIADKRNIIRDIRNNKTHKAESELIRNKVQFSEGNIGDKPTTFIMHTIDNLPIVPYKTLLICKEFYITCTEKINEIIKLTEEYLLVKYEELLNDFYEMGVYKIGMGQYTSLTGLNLE
ncbi:Cthe_2314 family HEPN domain-containing protein [Metabacillus litoralis]|uniref:Cthe_2314 family HEPN domain-containing protein n=1 Tax=Metabacillus litoralis TaxID=152268 RepID=UPI000EF5B80D|nr:Cthe_2314 family HEPN domain-containing protein [Metabacillus litoralis]